MLCAPVPLPPQTCLVAKAKYLSADQNSKHQVGRNNKTQYFPAERNFRNIQNIHACKRSAMKQQYFYRWIIANTFCPDLKFSNWCFNWNQLDVSVWISEVALVESTCVSFLCWQENNNRTDIILKKNCFIELF